MLTTTFHKSVSILCLFQGCKSNKELLISTYQVSIFQSEAAYIYHAPQE